jgi:hypothetical protein
MNESHVERSLRDQVEGVPLAHRLRAHKERPDGVEEELTNHPHDLEQGSTQREEPRLAGGGNIRVDGVVALEHVVLEVVLLERHGEGDADGKVHHEAQRAVRAGALEREVVAQLVVRQEQVSGDETPKGIRGEQQHGPRRVVPQPPGHRELEAHDGEDLRAGGPVRAIQVLDLRVLLEDLPPSLRVRLLWGRGLGVGERSASADVRIRDSGVTATRRRIRMAERWKHRNSDVAARAPSVAMRSGGRRDADVREWERGTDEGTYIILAPVEVTRLLRLELAARHGGRSFGPRASYDVTRKLDGRRRTAATRSDSRGFCARRDGCDTTDGSSEVVQMRVSGNEPRVTRSGRRW